MAIATGNESMRVALIVKNADPSELFQILVMRQERPAGSEGGDTEVWDLPSSPLPRLPKCGRTGSEDDQLSKAVSNVKFYCECLGLTKGFNFHHVVAQIQACVCPTGGLSKSWRFWKYVEEPAFGPGPPIHTIIFITETYREDACFSENGQWVDPNRAYHMLVNASAKEDRLGPLAMVFFSSHFPARSSLKYNLNVHGQEYPPGVFVAPMDSATISPFSKTNMVVFAPTAPYPIDTNVVVACGDALICDPGCYPAAAQSQLAKVVNELPKKLLIFITHHHHDHIDGLPVVRQNNPDSIIIAHEKTIQRMGKTTAGLKCIAVDGGSKLLIGSQELEIISAPGHTDGHLGLYDDSTSTLLVGDHCVGQGSSVLDQFSGGNMQDYLETCHRFIKLAPKVIVPAHGYPNLWPIHMLQGYIKHREAREAKVLGAIEGGARTAYQVVAQVYKDTPTAFWPGALSNVKLHIERLNHLNKLPFDFNMEEFERSSKVAFAIRCIPAITHRYMRKPLLSLANSPIAGTLSAIVVLGVVAFLWTKRK